MWASAGGLFTSLLSWSIPQSVQNRVVFFFLRNTLGQYLSSPDLNSLDSFEFHNGALLLQNLEFDISAVQEILPGWAPSFRKVYIESIRVQLPWPNIFTGTVQVTVSAPRARMLFKDHTDPSSPPGSPEIELHDSSAFDINTPQGTDVVEHPDNAHETSTSTLENLVASFGKALVQRLKILVEDVDVRIRFRCGAVILKVQEFSFDGEKECMSCSNTRIQALRPRPDADFGVKHPPNSANLSPKFPLSEEDAPDYIALDILRIEECIKFHVHLADPGGVPLISLEMPCIKIMASSCDIQFFSALVETVFRSLQSSQGLSNNTLDLSIVSSCIHLHISRLVICILFQEVERNSMIDLGSHLAVDCENLAVEANFDGTRISSSTSRIERFTIHEILMNGDRLPFIRINGKHKSKDVIPADLPEWPLGYHHIGQGGWSYINPLPSSPEQAICVIQSGLEIHMDIAPAQLLFDSEMIHRALPLLQSFGTSSSEASTQDKSSVPWALIHGLLTFAPIMTISCEKAQMALRVPEAQISDSKCSFKGPRSGVWILECSDIRTMNSRPQELPTSECVHVDTSNVSIYHSTHCELARCLCNFQSTGDKAKSGIQIDIRLNSVPAQSCTANLSLEIPDLIVALDNPFVRSMYYLADDILIFASAIASSWNHMLLQTVRVSTDSKPKPEAESRPSLESFSSGASIHISLKHGV